MDYVRVVVDTKGNFGFMEDSLTTTDGGAVEQVLDWVEKFGPPTRVLVLTFEVDSDLMPCTYGYMAVVNEVRLVSIAPESDGVKWLTKIGVSLPFVLRKED